MFCIILNIKILLNKIKLRGPKTSMNTIESLLESREESFFHLAQFVTCRESWNNPNIHGWSPYCALSILAKMHSYGALLAINTAMIYYTKHAHDWIIIDAPNILAHFGPDFIRPITALMWHTGADILIRTRAEIALLVIAKSHPETKHQIVESIKACAMAESNIKNRDQILGYMLYIDEPEMHKYLHELMDEGHATDDCYNLYHFNDGSGHDFKIHLERAKDPLLFFEVGKHMPPNNPKSTVSLQEGTKRKVGRNDPCACGSGIKYKKCCLRN